MPITTIPAVEYKCDGCGSVTYNSPRAKQIGYTGKVKQTFPSGAVKRADWYAHTQRCIANAVRNVLKGQLPEPESLPSGAVSGSLPDGSLGPIR